VHNRLERHAAAFVLSIIKIHAAAWRLQAFAFAQRVKQRAVATLCGLLERHGRVVSAPRARCKDAM